MEISHNLHQMEKLAGRVQDLETKMGEMQIKEVSVEMCFMVVE
jgi:hypothetical protein